MCSSSYPLAAARASLPRPEPRQQSSSLQMQRCARADRLGAVLLQLPSACQGLVLDTSLFGCLQAVAWVPLLDVTMQQRAAHVLLLDSDTWALLCQGEAHVVGI